MLEKSCGAVLYTIENNEILYLLIRDSRGICGLPKGHVEPGETEVETALREVWEETSIRPELISGFRAEIQYKLENGNDKQVVYYLGRFFGQTPRRNAGFEQFDYLLVPFQQAYDSIRFQNAKELLRKANAFVRETAIHHMKLHDQPFRMIADGRKTIELRLYDEKRQRIREGDTIVFSRSRESEQQICAKVIRLHRFGSFAELYRVLPLEKCGYLPEEIASASPADMEAYYTAEEQARCGVVGIELELFGR